MSTTAENKIPRTIMMPVTTMEEMPLLSEAERAEMLASLKEAEARMAAGEGIEHDPDTFVERLMAIRAAEPSAVITGPGGARMAEPARNG